MYKEDLESKSQVKVRQAAEKISNGSIEADGDLLLETLFRFIDSPKAWKTQCALIKAIAITKHVKSIEPLKNLTKTSFDSTLIYNELGFAIFVLENVKSYTVDCLFDFIKKDNQMLISGACAGMLHSQTIPPKEDIVKIISSIKKYTEKEGPILTPRCYIAALAYLWPKELVIDFLCECKKSEWQGLVEIADCSLQGKASKYKLI